MILTNDTRIKQVGGFKCMRKKTLITLFVMVLTAIGICGCGSGNKIVGSWTTEDSDITIVFEKRWNQIV